MLVFSKSSLSPHFCFLFTSNFRFSCNVVSSYFVLVSPFRHWIGASRVSASEDLIYNYQVATIGATTQFSILSTIYPTLSSFLQPHHFADLPCSFPKVTFCSYLNAGCSPNIVTRRILLSQKEYTNFKGLLLGHCWTRIFRRTNIMYFQNTLFPYFLLPWQVRVGLAHIVTV